MEWNNIRQWTDVNWVAFGDSLTDNTGTYDESCPNKYHELIKTNLNATVTVLGVGGTGYWRRYENGSAYYQRMRNATANASVNIVTIFGSVNDHTLYVTGNPVTYATDAGKAKDGGQPVTFFDLGDPTFPSDASISAAIARMSLDDTITAGDTTFVAYVNECINEAHAKFPTAKVVLVHEIAYYNTKAGQLKKERAIKEAIVNKRRANGDDWLLLFKLNEANFTGIDDSERKYVNTVANAGLSFDFGQLNDGTFRAYYTYDNVGHPSTLYNRLWLGPMYAAIIRSCFPNLPAPSASLSVGSYDISGLFIGDPAGEGGSPDEPDPTPPTPPVQTYGSLYLFGGQKITLAQAIGMGLAKTSVVWKFGGNVRIDLANGGEVPDDDTSLAILGSGVLGSMILGKSS